MSSKATDKISIQWVKSPCGDLLLGAYQGQLCMCDWPDAKHHAAVLGRLHRTLDADFEMDFPQVMQDAVQQLEAYFSGEQREFALPLLLVGTEFQKQVWQALQQIPYGTTLSYGALATRLGMPNAVRAVANAVGGNGLSIIVPCHRILGINHALTGYAGGLEAKQYLLELERNNL